MRNVGRLLSRMFYYPNGHKCIFKHSFSLSDADFKPFTLLEGYKLPSGSATVFVLNFPTLNFKS